MNFSVDSWVFVFTLPNSWGIPRTLSTLHQLIPFLFFPGSPVASLPITRCEVSMLTQHQHPHATSKPLYPPYLPSHTGRIWLDNLSCSGTEPV